MNNKKILFVADAKSIHTAKWVDYFVEQDYEVYLATFANENVTNFAVNTTVGYDAYSAYVQYAGTYSKDAFAAGDKSYNSALNTWVEYDGFANTYLDFGVNVMSLNDSPEDSVEIYSTVDYTMGAITYEMAPEYDFADGDDTFSILWNVQMDF